jgi:hypothetical protein
MGRLYDHIMPAVSELGRDNRMLCHGKSGIATGINQSPEHASLKSVCFFVFLFVSALFLGFAAASSITASAKQLDAKLSLIEFYMQAAFANKEKALKRFVTKDRFEVNLSCPDISCGENIRRLKAYLPIRIFDTVVSETLSRNSDINILILDDQEGSINDSLLNSKIFTVEANEIAVADGDKQCGALAIRNRDTSQIKKLAVVTVRSDDPQRDTACLILQIIRGSGLSFADDFSSFWKNQKEISSTNPAEFENRMTILSAIVSFHFNKHTENGMSSFDTKSELEKQSLDELRGVN